MHYNLIKRCLIFHQIGGKVNFDPPPRNIPRAAYFKCVYLRDVAHSPQNLYIQDTLLELRDTGCVSNSFTKMISIAIQSTSGPQRDQKIILYYNMPISYTLHILYVKENFAEILRITNQQQIILSFFTNHTICKHTLRPAIFKKR